MKYIKLIIFLSVFFFITSVNASSINYNLNIDDNKNFHESIIYTFDENTKSDYLKSLINNDVSFDGSQFYKKKINLTNGQYTIEFKYDYNYKNINNHRLLKSCFKEFNLETDNYEMAFYALPKFSCFDHADNIIVSVTTNINIINSNSNKVVGNTQIWNNINSDFYINMELGNIDPQSNDLPPLQRTDEDYQYFDPSMIAPDSKPKSNNTVTLIIMSFSVLIIIVLTLIIRKRYVKRTQYYDIEDNYTIF